MVVKSMALQSDRPSSTYNYTVSNTEQALNKKWWWWLVISMSLLLNSKIPKESKISRRELRKRTGSPASINEQQDWYQVNSNLCSWKFHKQRDFCVLSSQYPPTTITVADTWRTLTYLLDELINTSGSSPLCTGRAVKRSQPSLHSSLCPKTQTPDVALSQWFSKYNFQNSSSSIWELVRNANYQVPLKAYRIRNSRGGPWAQESVFS